MKSVLFALLIGIGAGIIDIIPMIIKKEKMHSVLSAFIHWTVLGLIIPFVNWDIVAWLKGSIIGLLAALPMLIIIGKSDKNAIIPITIMSALLGAAVGQVGIIFINNY